MDRQSNQLQKQQAVYFIDNTYQFVHLAPGTFRRMSPRPIVLKPSHFAPSAKKSLLSPLVIVVWLLLSVTTISVDEELEEAIDCEFLMSSDATLEDVVDASILHYLKKPSQPCKAL